MKKYLAIILGVLFILSFTAVSFAEDKPEITLGGKILVRGWYFDNVNFFPGPSVPQSTQSHAFYSTNVNLMLDAKVTDNVRGFIELETASGGNRNSGLYYWGVGDSSIAGTYDTKPNTQIEIRQAWIQYTGSGLLGIPAGIKIGHMPISLGEKQFLNNERFGDDAILAWIDPMKELHIAAGTTKLNEGDILKHDDDLDGYVLFATYMLDKDNTLGVNWLWAHSDGNCPSSLTDTGETDDNGNPILIASPVPNVEKLNFHNIGVHANGKVAGLSYAAEADFQFGKLEALNNAEDLGILFPTRDLKPKGWAVMAKLGYMLDPVNIRAAFAMGSGDDNANDGDCKEFQTLQGPDYSPTARLVHYTQIYERTLRTASVEAALTTKAGGNAINTGLANTTYYNLGVDVNPVKELSISVDGFLLRATKTGAWEDILSEAAGEKVNVSKKLGWEIDSKLSYKIAKNLTYFVEAGWFMADNFYTDIGADDKTVTQLVHGLSLTF